MTLTTLIDDAEDFPTRLRRRNELLRDAYRLLDGSPWMRFETLAFLAAALRPVWREHQYSAMPPPGLTAIQLAIWKAAKISGKLPPQTAWGVRAALLSLGRGDEDLSTFKSNP